MKFFKDKNKKTDNSIIDKENSNLEKDGSFNDELNNSSPINNEEHIESSFNDDSNIDSSLKNEDLIDLEPNNKKKEPLVFEDENLVLLTKPTDDHIYLLLPSNFVIGYYEGMTAKGLREYINGYVFKYFNSPNVTSYKMLKYNSGYVFEIHDGDPKTSYLKCVLDSFNDGKNVVLVKTQNRIAKITKNFNKIDTYLLPEADTVRYPDAILPEKGKMKPIMTTGFGMVSFGLAMAFMGVTSLFLSSLFKTVLGRDEKVEIEKQKLELPSSYIEKIPMATETKYVSKVWFQDGKWNKKEKQIKTPEMVLRDTNNAIISKIEPYKIFVQKCYTKIKSFEQCNDVNPFFDTLDFKNNPSINFVTVKDGVIKIEFNNGDFINYLPTINNQNLIWNYECSKTGIADICSTPQSIIIKSKEKSLVSDLIPAITTVKEVKKESLEKKKEEKVINEKIIVNDVKNIESKIQTPLNNIKVKKEDTVSPVIIEKPFKINPPIVEKSVVKTPTVAEIKKVDETKKAKDILINPDNNKNTESGKNIPNTLNLNNLSDNILVD